MKVEKMRGEKGTGRRRERGGGGRKWVYKIRIKSHRIDKYQFTRNQKGRKLYLCIYLSDAALSLSL